MGSSSCVQDVHKSFNDFTNPAKKFMQSASRTPIIVVLDVSNSNIRLAHIVADKMTMFYDQIKQYGYLEDFDICLCAVGDEVFDSYPLQVTDFARRPELDSWLEKIIFEGNGGPFGMESYEVAAYYILESLETRRNARPIVFFIGDEAPYPLVSRHSISKYHLNFSTSIEPFSALSKKVHGNLFMLLNKAYGREFKSDITSTWERLLSPQHVIKINDEESVINLMLDVISRTYK